MSEGWNPIYVAYATAHGNTPERQLEADKSAYPGGGCMINFMLWMGAATRKATGAAGSGVNDGRVCDHKAFTTWLKANATTI